MRSLWWALMQRSWCPHTRGKFGHRDTNRSATMWIDTRRRRPSTSQGERPRTNPSSALRKHKTRQYRDVSPSTQPYHTEYFSLSLSIHFWHSLWLSTQEEPLCGQLGIDGQPSPMHWVRLPRQMWLWGPGVVFGHQRTTSSWGSKMHPSIQNAMQLTVIWDSIITNNYYDVTARSVSTLAGDCCYTRVRNSNTRYVYTGTLSCPR